MSTTRAELGINRTGIGLSPNLAASMVEATREFEPSSRGDERALGEERATYARKSDSMGSVPPPPTAKGVVKALAQGLRGGLPTQLLDKLGERLAFERTGVRIYEVLLSKFDSHGSFEGGPSRDELERIMSQEHAHFRMLERAIAELGADPTVVTPSANFHATMSQGIIASVSDPRTSLAQCLEALLVIELVDNECWEALIELAGEAELDELVVEFTRAVEDEVGHLSLVRGWIAAAQQRPASPDLVEAIL